jgi:hypothetical protein
MLLSGFWFYWIISRCDLLMNVAGGMQRGNGLLVCYECGECGGCVMSIIDGDEVDVASCHGSVFVEMTMAKSLYKE